jgi:hypothetical protein
MEADGAVYGAVSIRPETKRALLQRKLALGMKTYSDMIDYLLALETERSGVRVMASPKRTAPTEATLIEKASSME